MDGSGKVDGSIVVALPIDRWPAPESVNSFVGHGGVSSVVPKALATCSIPTEWSCQPSQLTNYAMYIYLKPPQGLTFWDGRNQETGKPHEIHYETRSGDLAFIDRYVDFRVRSSICYKNKEKDSTSLVSAAFLPIVLSGIKQILLPKAPDGHSLSFTECIKIVLSRQDSGVKCPY